MRGRTRGEGEGDNNDNDCSLRRGTARGPRNMHHSPKQIPGGRTGLFPYPRRTRPFSSDWRNFVMGGVPGGLGKGTSSGTLRTRQKDPEHGSLSVVWSVDRPLLPLSRLRTYGSDWSGRVLPEGLFSGGVLSWAPSTVSPVSGTEIPVKFTGVGSTLRRRCLFHSRRLPLDLQTHSAPGETWNQRSRQLPLYR